QSVALREVMDEARRKVSEHARQVA
ncbi:MAG: hypothetical protein V7640_3371, partial [Betaproteobacteria bacterium]